MLSDGEGGVKAHVATAADHEPFDWLASASEALSDPSHVLLDLGQRVAPGTHVLNLDYHPAAPIAPAAEQIDSAAVALAHPLAVNHLQIEPRRTQNGDVRLNRVFDFPFALANRCDAVALGPRDLARVAALALIQQGGKALPDPIRNLPRGSARSA